MNELTYNGKNFSEFGAFYDSHSAFDSPERDVEMVEVYGRNGDYIIDNDRFRNIEVTFPCYINTSFLTSYRALMAFLQSSKGYNRLEYSQEPNHYRMAAFIAGSQPTPNQLHNSGQFLVVFNCKPQRYLKTGDTAVDCTSLASITNPTLFPAKPLIRLYGTGTLGIGSQYITVSAHSYPYIDVDCELMDARYGMTNCNQYVSFSTTDYITLEAGANALDNDGFSQVEITPRWYEV